MASCDTADTRRFLIRMFVYRVETRTRKKVKVTERKRTMSMTFWGGEHASQDAAANVTASVTSLEDENYRWIMVLED